VSSALLLKIFRSLEKANFLALVFTIFIQNRFNDLAKPLAGVDSGFLSCDFSLSLSLSLSLTPALEKKLFLF